MKEERDKGVFENNFLSINQDGNFHTHHSVSNFQTEFNSDLNQRLKLEERIKLGCVMNKNIYSKQEYIYSVKQCFTCPGKLENICDYCYHHCHQDHNSNIKGVSLIDKKVNISKVQCDCALRNHDFKAGIVSARSSENEEAMKNRCPINDILSLIDPKYYLYDTFENKFICFFCRENCYKEEDNIGVDNDSNDIIDNEIDLQRKLKNKKQKQKEGEEQLNINNINELNMNIDLNETEKSKALSNISLNNKYTLIDNRFGIVYSSSLIVHPHCQCNHKDMHHSMIENINNIITLIESDLYDIHLNRLKIPYQLLTSKTSIVSNILEQFIATFVNISSSYNNFLASGGEEDNPLNFNPSKELEASMKMISEISNLFSKNHKMLSLPKISEFYSFPFIYSLVDNFKDISNIGNETKVTVLADYRKFTLEPCLELGNNIYKYLGYNENNSFFHRMLFLTRHEPLKQLNISKKKFLKFMNKMTEYINFLHEKISEKVFMKFVLEYVKYYTLIINSLYYELNNLEKITDNLTKILYLVKQNANFLDVMSDLEYIVYNIILFKNDFVLRKKLNLNFLDESYRTYNEDEMSFAAFVQLNKFGLKKEDNHKYVFENEDIFNQKIVKLLFIYTPENYHLASKYLKNDYLYDNLINENDYYSDFINNFIESDFKPLTKEVTDVLFRTINHGLVDILMETPQDNQNTTSFFSKKVSTPDDYKQSSPGLNITPLLLKTNKLCFTSLATDLLDLNPTNYRPQNPVQDMDSSIVNLNQTLQGQNFSIQYLNKESTLDNTVLSNKYLNTSNYSHLFKLVSNNLDFDYYTVLGEKLTNLLLQKFAHFNNIIHKVFQSETFNEKKFLYQIFYTLEGIFVEIKNEMKNQELSFCSLEEESNYQFNFRVEEINSAFNSLREKANNSILFMEGKDEDIKKEKTNDFKELILQQLNKNQTIKEVNKAYYNALDNKSKLFVFQVSLFKIGLFDNLITIWNTIIKTPFIYNMIIADIKPIHKIIKEYNDFNLNIFTLNSKEKENQTLRSLILDIEHFILGIMDLMTENNMYLSPILFNKRVLKKFIRGELVVQDKLPWYITKMQQLKAGNYKVNCEFLMKRVLEFVSPSLLVKKVELVSF